MATWKKSIKSLNLKMVLQNRNQDTSFAGRDTGPITRRSTALSSGNIKLKFRKRPQEWQTSVNGYIDCGAYYVKVCTIIWQMKRRRWFSGDRWRQRAFSGIWECEAHTSWNAAYVRVCLTSIAKQTSWIATSRRYPKLKTTVYLNLSIMNLAREKRRLSTKLLIRSYTGSSLGAL